MGSAKIIVIVSFLILASVTVSVLQQSRIPTQRITDYTSLSDAVRAGDTSAAKRLIALGSDLYETNPGDTYKTPLLHIAATRGDLPMVKCLIEAGANINETDSGVGPEEYWTLRIENITALHCAASNGHMQVVKYLLQNGADVNCYTTYGKTPLTMACTAIGQDELITLLLDYGADINAESPEEGTILMSAVCQNNLKLIQLLLDRGADINATGRDDTALTIAVRNDNPELVRFLLEHGADPTDGVPTPLHVAAELDEANTTEIVLLLLAHGADIDAEVCKSCQSGTPLMIATQNNNQKIALLLLSQGADVNKVDDVIGESPLHAAARYGYVDMMNLLIKHGANIEQKDMNGLTAIELAGKHDYTTNHE